MSPYITLKESCRFIGCVLSQRGHCRLGHEASDHSIPITTSYKPWWWRPTQAHNGYIETYLNLGLVGLGLLAGLLLSTFRRISRSLLNDFDFARLRLALLFAILLFNYTEAAFKAVHFIWTILFVIAMEPPKRRQHDGIAVLSSRRTSVNDGLRIRPSR